MRGLHILHVIYLILFFVLGAGTALAQDDIHLRQGLLAEQAHRAQRIAKSACLVMSGANSQLHADAAVENALAFSATMAVLIDGDTEADIAALPDGPERAEMIETERLSKGLTISARQVVAGDLQAVPVALILSRTEMIAQRLQRHAAEMRAPDEARPEAISKAIKVLHAQNALIEGVLKELCYLRLSLGPFGTKDRFAANLATFAARNDALVVGDTALGVEKAPNIKIKITLGQITSKWTSFESLLTASVEASAQDLRDSQLASVIGGTISGRLTKLVKMYEDL